MICMILRQFNIYVDEAENGLAAFNKSKTTKYDFILLDINMPIMDGFEACKRIKKSQTKDFRALLQINDYSKSINACCLEEEEGKENKVPLIMALSAHITKKDIEIGREAGFDDFCKYFILLHIYI